MNKPNPGDIFIIPNENREYEILKVIAVDDEGIHLRFYEDIFTDKPTSVCTETLEWFLGHIPMSWDVWDDMEKEQIQNDPVSKEELEGYLYWKDEVGGVFQDSDN